MSRILFIAAHPDDETLGCGGTILRHKARGDEVFLLLVTHMSEGAGYSSGQIKEREEEIEQVAKSYAFEEVVNLCLPPARLDEIPATEFIGKLGEVINQIKPDVVYVNNRTDIHSDHRVLFDAVASATKTFRCPFIKKVLMYEVISETEFAPPFQEGAFVPNFFVEISEFLEKKIEIMRVYKSEVGKHPYPRSVDNIKALATYRGATAGVKYAEAFMILKEVW